MLTADRFLFISAHPDDSELSAGGLIHYLARQNKAIKLLVLSNPTISLPPGFEGNVLLDEQIEAAAELGLTQDNLIFMDFPVRRFSEHRQDILEELVLIRKDFDPQYVFTSHCDDIHQDHSQVGLEAKRAFSKQNLLFFEAPWNGSQFRGNFTVPLEDIDIAAKQKAIQCFQSQQHRVYSSEEYIFGLARMRGAMIGREFAESFEVSSMHL